MDAVWEQGITNQDESDDESNPEHKINEVIQAVDTPKTLSRQTSVEETQGPLMELDDSVDLHGRPLDQQCKPFFGYQTLWPGIN